MQIYDIIRAGIAGAGGTVIMAIIMLSVSLLDFPMTDLGSALVSLFNGDLLLGWSIYSIIGIFLGIGYVLFASSILKGSPTIKGVLYGIILGIVVLLIVGPILGFGFIASNSPQPIKTIFGIFVIHIVYGVSISVFMRSRESF